MREGMVKTRKKPQKATGEQFGKINMGYCCSLAERAKHKVSVAKLFIAYLRDKEKNSTPLIESFLRGCEDKVLVPEKVFKEIAEKNFNKR